MINPHSFLPTMGHGPAQGPCQMKRPACGLPYEDLIHRPSREEREMTDPAPAQHPVSAMFAHLAEAIDNGGPAPYALTIGHTSNIKMQVSTVEELKWWAVWMGVTSITIEQDWTANTDHYSAHETIDATGSRLEVWTTRKRVDTSTTAHVPLAELR